jgi:hypothetical protein
MESIISFIQDRERLKSITSNIEGKRKDDLGMWKIFTNITRGEMLKRTCDLRRDPTVGFEETARTLYDQNEAVSVLRVFSSEKTRRQIYGFNL